MTGTFLPLVAAQAKARRAEPRLVVVEHPVGGLSTDELASRIEAGYAGVSRELDRVEEP